MIGKVYCYPSYPDPKILVQDLAAVLQEVERRASTRLVGPEVRYILKDLLGSIQSGRVYYARLHGGKVRKKYYKYDYQSTCAVIAARRRRGEVRVGIWAHRKTYHPWNEPDFSDLPGKWGALLRMYPEDTERLMRLQRYCQARKVVGRDVGWRAKKRQCWALLRPLVLSEGLFILDIKSEDNGFWLHIGAEQFIFLHASGLHINLKRRELPARIRRIFQSLDAGEISRDQAEAELVLVSLKSLK